MCLHTPLTTHVYTHSCVYIHTHVSSTFDFLSTVCICSFWCPGSKVGPALFCFWNNLCWAMREAWGLSGAFRGGGGTFQKHAFGCIFWMVF